MHPIHTKKRPSVKKVMVLLIVLSLTIFFLLAFFYQRHLLSQETAHLKNHATVISTSLWSYEPQAPRAYLMLAVEANKYEHATIFDEQNQVFLHIEGTPYTRIETLLFTLGLLRTYQLKEPITFNGTTIGHINVKWVCRAIYPFLYILFCLLLFLTGIWLFLTLLDAKALLEQRVLARTAKLEKEVHERKKAEEKLRLQAQHLSMHVQHTPLAVIEWNLNFEIVEWNKAAEVIFGFSRDEALGKTPYELLLPEEEKKQLHKLWDKLTNQRGSIRQINTNLTKNKEIKTCEWFNTPLLNSHGDIVGVASLALDITDRLKAEQANKMLQEQLLQSQKMEAIGNLAGGISHDFNNLLQGISGYTQLMLATCDPTSKNYSHLQGIFQATERAADLIRQLLTLSRKVESALGPLNLNEQVTQVRAILDHTIPKMIDIKIDLAPDLYTINADPVQVEQIILNMAINAHQAMPDGGTLSISTANTCLDDAFCAKHLQATQGPNVMLKIADNGLGMDQATQERIFEPFFTTKEVGQGTGLGLSTVYGIIQSHGAYIQCVSSPGKGTEFTIYFPAIARQQEHLDLPQEENVDLGGNETVLIVDDENIVREIGAEILSSHGYATLLAESGEEAVQIYAANTNKIDIVIMDLNMPGMGGFNSIRKLKALDPNVCILVASGYIPTESVKQATELGADGFISKPFQVMSLLNKIQKTLAIARQTKA